MVSFGYAGLPVEFHHCNMSRLVLSSLPREQLLQAALELRVRPTSAAVADELQSRYKQHGHAESVVEAIQELVSTEDKDSTEREVLITRGNLRDMPKLPLRLEPDAQQHKNLFHFANIRLVKLASSYTDLHSEVLGKSVLQLVLPQGVAHFELELLVAELLEHGQVKYCGLNSAGLFNTTLSALSCGHVAQHKVMWRGGCFLQRWLMVHLY
ncbi:hypothetical protein ON010_g2303 [Phytophthora cinnamomi]|nr:hypothetical protein ON010_g2303 [Phytophthora cinnamomi]